VTDLGLRVGRGPVSHVLGEQARDPRDVTGPPRALVLGDPPHHAVLIHEATLPRPRSAATDFLARIDAADQPGEGSSGVGRVPSEAESGLREPALGERQHLRGSHLEHHCGSAVPVTKRPLLDGEVPVAVLFAAPEIGESP
jgi:hypothetical protein